MDPRRQEDLNLGPDHADAFIAGSDRDPPQTNTVTESAIVTYTESPLATLRKRDLEYHRLHRANSPEQRDPEKRSRQLPAEYGDEDMGSDNKSDLVPSSALDASEAGPSDLSGSELSLEPRSSLEELPFWESYDDSTFPTQDLVHYDGDPVSTTNVHFDDAFTPEDGSIVPFSHSTDTLSPTSSAITRTVTTVVSRTVTETTSARTIRQLLPLPEHDELGLVAAGPGNYANRQGPELPALSHDLCQRALVHISRLIKLQVLKSLRLNMLFLTDLPLVRTTSLHDVGTALGPMTNLKQCTGTHLFWDPLINPTSLPQYPSLQDQASVCQQLRSGLLCNEDRFQTELHQLQQEVQSLRLLQSDFQTWVPAEFSETGRLLEEIVKSNVSDADVSVATSSSSVPSKNEQPKRVLTALGAPGVVCPVQTTNQPVKELPIDWADSSLSVEQRELLR
ncbi:hypothetical protein AC1031_010929 [Aphanomyces cochlioides]|nr:hypothetical protein AC1031_010929 [Aphanomyces cochlioides]